MAFININDLDNTGIELFQDSESYLHEITNMNENIYGGEVMGTGAVNPPSSTGLVFSIIEKGYEFAAYTLGIDALANIIKSYSAPK